VFHFSIDSLKNLTILLFTPTNSIDFSTQLCGTLSLLLLLLVVVVVVVVVSHFSLLSFGWEIFTYRGME